MSVGMWAIDYWCRIFSSYTELTGWKVTLWWHNHTSWQGVKISLASWIFLCAFPVMILSDIYTFLMRYVLMYTFKQWDFEIQGGFSTTDLSPETKILKILILKSFR